MSAQVHIHILVVTTCTMRLVFSWVQSLQLGILNVIEAMNFAPEIVYPLYLSASSDRYSILEFCLKYVGIFTWTNNHANHYLSTAKSQFLRKEKSS
jgi:hypothetical protein